VIDRFVNRIPPGLAGAPRASLTMPTVPASISSAPSTRRHKSIVKITPYTTTVDVTPVLADSGYEGAGCGVLAPFKRRTDGIALHADQRTYNRLMRGLRALGELFWSSAGKHFGTSP
jgi:hypothetical protein